MTRSASLPLAVLFGALIACASTAPLWRDTGDTLDFLLLFSLPGVIVSLPLGVMGVVGTAHDPNTVVTAVVDGLFYAAFFYWLMMRRLRRES